MNLFDVYYYRNMLLSFHHIRATNSENILLWNNFFGLRYLYISFFIEQLTNYLTEVLPIFYISTYYYWYKQSYQVWDWFGYTYIAILGQQLLSHGPVYIYVNKISMLQICHLCNRFCRMKQIMFLYFHAVC